MQRREETVILKIFRSYFKCAKWPVVFVSFGVIVNLQFPVIHLESLANKDRLFRNRH